MIRLVNKMDSGIQHLQARIIKDAMLAIPNVICDLINNSFELGIFPRLEASYNGTNSRVETRGTRETTAPYHFYLCQAN